MLKTRGPSSLQLNNIGVKEVDVNKLGLKLSIPINMNEIVIHQVIS